MSSSHHPWRSILIMDDNSCSFSFVLQCNHTDEVVNSNYMEVMGSLLAHKQHTERMQYEH